MMTLDASVHINRLWIQMSPLDNHVQYILSGKKTFAADSIDKAYMYRPHDHMD